MREARSVGGGKGREGGGDVVPKEGEEGGQVG
jgi:hypothetical protein